MKTKTGRLLALMLALIMICAMIPQTALADGERIIVEGSSEVDANSQSYLTSLPPATIKIDVTGINPEFSTDSEGMLFLEYDERMTGKQLTFNNLTHTYIDDIMVFYTGELQDI